jgi:hypothetical protein
VVFCTRLEYVSPILKSSSLHRKMPADLRTDGLTWSDDIELDNEWREVFFLLYLAWLDRTRPLEFPWTRDRIHAWMRRDLHEEMDEWGRFHDYMHRHFKLEVVIADAAQ